MRPCTSTAFGEGSGNIHLEDVACSGPESKLLDCPASPAGNLSCDHSKDIGVGCTIEGNDVRFVCLKNYLYPKPLSKATPCVMSQQNLATTSPDFVAQ